MKTSRFAFRALAAALLLGLASCTTTYDAYGRPVQTVDPGLALAGVAAAGLIGYAIAEGNDDYHGGHRNYYGHGGYHNNYHGYGHGGYYRPSYCRPHW